MKTDSFGRNIADVDELIELMFSGHDISELYVADSDQVKSYNEQCIKFDKTKYTINPIERLDITPEEYHFDRQNKWFIPDKYLRIDVRRHLIDLCYDQLEIDRVNSEMDEFEKRNLVSVLQLMMYLVDYWREQKIVWGVGRGSSVASYCLFLIGIHRINSLEYDLAIDEFLK